MGTHIANMPQSLVIFGAILPIGAFAIPDTVVAEPPEGSKVESFQDSSDVPEFLETDDGCPAYNGYTGGRDTGGTCWMSRTFGGGTCDISRHATCDDNNHCICAMGLCAVKGACVPAKLLKIDKALACVINPTLCTGGR